VSFVCILLFLPETLRALVGDGSIPPPRLYTPLIPIIGRSREQTPDCERPPRRRFQNPFALLLYPDIALLLALNAIAYAVLYGITATISSLFQIAYPSLSETDIGLCFLALGGGMLIATLTNGRVLDNEYRNIKEKMIRNLRTIQVEKGEAAQPGDVTKDEYFPIEYARLRLLPFYLIIDIICTIGYGWSLQRRVSLAVPLILHIFIGYCVFGMMNGTQTLLVDLTPGSSSSVTACNNLVRCSLGAALVSIVDIIINALGIGWTYTLFGCICILCLPMTWLELRMGPVWRARRRERRKAKECN